MILNLHKSSLTLTRRLEDLGLILASSKANGFQHNGQTLKTSGSDIAAVLIFYAGTLSPGIHLQSCPMCTAPNEGFAVRKLLQVGQVSCVLEPTDLHLSVGKGFSSLLAWLSSSGWEVLPLLDGSHDLHQPAQLGGRVLWSGLAQSHWMPEEA